MRNASELWHIKMYSMLNKIMKGRVYLKRDLCKMTKYINIAYILLLTETQTSVYSSHAINIALKENNVIIYFLT